MQAGYRTLDTPDRLQRSAQLSVQAKLQSCRASKSRAGSMFMRLLSKAETQEMTKATASKVLETSIVQKRKTVRIKIANTSYSYMPFKKARST